MSMHISCASKCSQYNYYYTVGVIINMLQKSKEKKTFEFSFTTFCKDNLAKYFIRYFP